MLKLFSFLFIDSLSNLIKPVCFCRERATTGKERRLQVSQLRCTWLLMYSLASKAGGSFDARYALPCPFGKAST